VYANKTAEFHNVILNCVGVTWLYTQLKFLFKKSAFFSMVTSGPDSLRR